MNDGSLANNASLDSANSLLKLKKGHRSRKGGPLPDPRSYDNLWDRLFDRYDLPEISHMDVDRELNWFINHPTYIDRVQSRAEPFLYSIVKQLEKNNMPGELALLPVIESAFQPHAVSPAHAAGIWQFIPTTGRHYGLKQSHSYDGRRDVYASTRAAIKYLKKLHSDFNGDWLLAIAGYNCGEGAVARAIQRNSARGLPTDFWSLDLPQETRSYVPRLLAVAKLFSEADQYGVNLRPIPNQALYKTVKMNSHVDLALAANAADISLDKMFELNPGFKKQHADVDGSYRLFIPAHKKIVDFKEELARQIEARQPDFAQDPQVDSSATESRNTDSTSQDDTKTASSAIQQAVQAAQAETQPAPLRVDSRSSMAAPQDSSSTRTEQSLDSQSEARRPSFEGAPSEDSASKSAPAEDRTSSYGSDSALSVAQNEANDSYVSSAASGQNSEISEDAAVVARAYERVVAKSSFRPVRKAVDEPTSYRRPKSDDNPAPSVHSEPAGSRMGQKSGRRDRDEPSAQSRDLVEPGNSGRKVAYVIHEGDTAYSIARKYDMDVDDLKKMNHLTHADDIKWGQSVMVVSKEAEKKPLGKGGAGVKSSQQSQLARYKAHDGETLFSISRRFNVTVADLRKWNGIKEDRQFRSGMNIKVAENKD